MTDPGGGLGDFWTLVLPNFADLGSGTVAMMTPALVIVIVVVAVWAIGYSAYHRRQATMRVGEVETLLKALNADNLWAKRGEVFAAAAGCSEVVRDSWREFDETLVSDNRRVYNTVSAEEFFTEYRFAPKLIGNRFLHSAPTALTTLGLLGTFLGLTVGLRSLDLGSTTDELKTGIQTLVDGAALGFTASFWGVSMSLVTNVAERVFEREVIARVRKLQATIDRLFPMRSPEQSLSDIAAHTSESQKALQVLHEKIGSALQESVSHVSDNTARAVTDAIQGSLAPIMEELAARAANTSADVFNAVSDQLTQSFRDIGADLATQLRDSSESMRSTLDYMGDQLARQADQHLTQMQDLGQATERQMRLLDESVPHVVAGLDRAASLVGAATTGMDAVVSGLSAITSTLSATSSELTAMLADAVDKMESLAGRTSSAADALAAQQASVAQLTEKAVAAAELLRAASAQFGEGFDGMRAAQDRFLGSLDQNLVAHSRTMAGWLTAYSSEVSKQTEVRMSEWNSHTEAFTRTMLSAAQALAEVVDELGAPAPEQDGDAAA